MCLCATTSFALQKQNLNCSWPEVKPLDQGSAVSTYTFHYWDFVKNNFSLYTSENLQKTGYVVGDFHFNNIAIYYSEQTQSARLAIADLDDSGVAPLLADYAKYVVSLKEKFKKPNFKPILQSYLNGLKGSANRSIPAEITQLLSQNKNYFSQLNTNYVLKKLNKDEDQFEKKYPLEKIKNLSEPYKTLAATTANNLQKSMTVLDSGFKYNTSGSSLDLLRIQYLVAHSQEQKQILELKQTRCPGTQLFQEQAEIADRYSQVLPLFKSEEYWKTTQLIPFNNDTFIFRIKLANALESLEIDKMSSQQAQVFSEYFAYLLGQYHSSQADNKYIQEIEKNLDFIQLKIDQFAINYLNKLKNDMKNNTRFL